MPLRRYLPSAQFTLMVVSLALSAGLVWAAQSITHPSPQSAAITANPNDTGVSSNSNWEATLYAIQAQNASTSLVAPSAESVGELLTSAQSPNVTDTVAKTLLINLTNAKSQGLGSDIPTQNQIIASAQAQVTAQGNVNLYTLADLAVVPDSAASLHTYGNALITVFGKHPVANQQNTFTAVGNAVNTGDATGLQALTPIKAGYAALTADLLAMPVPKTLAPFHLVIVNDFARVTGSYDGMQVMLADPLRGIVGFQTYQTSLAEAGRMFTNIAQALIKDGILFSKDEPGGAWSVLVSGQ